MSTAERGLWLAGGWGPDLGGEAEGVSLLDRRDDGSLQNLGLVAQLPSPSFLLREAGRLHIALEKAGRVESFVEHDFRPLGGSYSGGIEPCHLYPIADVLVVSHYANGALSVLRPGDRVLQVVSADGSSESIPGMESTAAHAHASIAVNDHQLLSLDLGRDRVELWEISEADDGPRLARLALTDLPAGSGPRDIVRLGSGRFLVLGESSAELFVIRVHGTKIETVSSVTLPGARRGDHAAAIAMTGAEVYVGLRGSNRISMVAVTGADDSLEGLDYVDCAGDWPRHVVVDGGVLHVANQLSSTVASFSRTTPGALALITDPVWVPSPTHLVHSSFGDMARVKPLVR